MLLGKQQGDNSVCRKRRSSQRLHLHTHDVSKNHPIEGLNRTVEVLKEEGFEATFWISVISNSD
jgi:hypothetical protein